MTYRVPSAREREAYCAFLVQATSVTAWQRVVAYHRPFLDIVRKAFEQTQQRPPAEGPPYIGSADMSLIYSCHDALERALERLRRGDRRCFRWLGAPGHFSGGMRAILAWDAELYRCYQLGESEFLPTLSPLWPEMEEAMRACLSVYNEIAIALEPEFTDVPAPLYSPDFDFEGGVDSLWHHLLATLIAPQLPIQPDRVLVPSGEPVTHSGIWEPVAASADAPRSLSREGCPNYLHAGSPAPTIAFDDDTPRREGRPTTWLLLWADDRYRDGSVPDAERAYRFFTPTPPDANRFDASDRPSRLGR